ncbi:MAG: M20/M25/M40 family metallo-hydrolase [bacterium]
MVSKQVFDAKISSYLEREQDRIVNDWLEVVQQPSISSTGEGVVECSELIAKKMKIIGIDTTVFPVKPYPVIFGQLGNDPANKTILIYAHYDVQPPDPIEEWKCPPFEAAIVDGIVYARGAADCKGPLVAHLKAAEFWLKEFGELPVNLKFIFEGCEENGSKGLPEFLRENRQLLDADFVYFSDGARHESGVPTIALGAKGMLSVELKLKTIDRDAHSMYAPVLPSAAWEILQLLNKLSHKGVVQIPGFYDDVIKMTDAEVEVLERLPDVAKKWRNNIKWFLL